MVIENVSVAGEPDAPTLAIGAIDTSRLTIKSAPLRATSSTSRMVCGPPSSRGIAGQLFHAANRDRNRDLHRATAACSGHSLPPAFAVGIDREIPRPCRYLAFGVGGTPGTGADTGGRSQALGVTCLMFGVTSASRRPSAHSTPPKSSD